MKRIAGNVKKLQLNTETVRDLRVKSAVRTGASGEDCTATKSNCSSIIHTRA